MEGETTYTVDEAAALLQETPERVREMLVTGELDGIPPGATLSGEWKVLLSTALGEENSPEDPDEGPPPDEHPEQPVEPPAVAEESSRGDDADAAPEPTAPSGWVSTQQAARALGISPRTVRWHIEQGNLAAKPEGEGVRRSWLVSIDSLQVFRDTRQDAGKMPRGSRAPAESSEIAAEGAGNAVRELADRLAEEAARAAEYRVRLELTEQAASTVRAELEEERRRRETAERERDELRRLLEDRPGPLASAGEAPAAGEKAKKDAPTADVPPAARGYAVTPTPQPGRVEPQAALEGTQEPRESSEMHMPEVGGGPLPHDQQRAARRPWWRRMFGG